MILRSPIEAERLVLRCSTRAYVLPIVWSLLVIALLGLRAGTGVRVFLALCALIAIAYRLAVWPRALVLDDTEFRVDWRLPILHPKVVRWQELEMLEAAVGGITNGIRYRVQGKDRRTLINCFLAPDGSRRVGAAELVSLMNGFREAPAL